LDHARFSHRVEATVGEEKRGQAGSGDGNYYAELFRA